MKFYIPWEYKMQVWVLFLVYIIIALIIALLFTRSRSLHRPLTDQEKSIAKPLTSLSAIIFALLLGFTVSNFFTRFTDIRNTIIDEVTNLELIYRILKRQPDNQVAIDAMKAYLQSVVTEEWTALENRKDTPITEELYRKMDTAIIEYVQTHASGSDNSILERLSTDERRKRLVTALQENNTLIIFIVIAALITLLGFWLLSDNSSQMMFLFDFSIIAVITIGIFLLVIFDRPFSVQGVGLTNQVYQDLLNEINGG